MIGERRRKKGGAAWVERETGRPTRRDPSTHFLPSSHSLTTRISPPVPMSSYIPSFLLSIVLVSIFCHRSNSSEGSEKGTIFPGRGELPFPTPMDGLKLRISLFYSDLLLADPYECCALLLDASSRRVCSTRASLPPLRLSLPLRIYAPVFRFIAIQTYYPSLKTPANSPPTQKPGQSLSEVF